MDFLTLFSCYILICVLVISLYLIEDCRFLKTGLIGQLRVGLYQSLLRTTSLVPQSVRTRILHWYDVVFYRKNAVFQTLYVMLVIGGHVILVVDAMPYLYTVSPDVNHVMTPLAFLLLNTALFIVCSVSDPGVVTSHNVDKYQGVYQPDFVLYKPNNRCPTCLFIKPARSKHCAISDRCYFKFDHYCAWTNNCVGGLNHRWFLLFLSSLVTMCVNGAVMAVHALVNVTNLYQLMTLRYLDARGQPQPMNIRVLTQTLFMQLPRLVFLAAALTVIGLFMAAFTVYHFYLAATNQTTNERYKRHRLSRLHNTRLLCHPYSRGFLQNLLEEVFPIQCRPPVSVPASRDSTCYHRKRR